MSIRFIPLSPQQTLKHYPQYSRRDITCFSIIKDGYCVGLYGLIDRGFDKNTGRHIGEGFLTIFPDFRYRILGKGFFLALFDHAFSSGFEVVYTWTRLTSWKKLLERFEPLGIHQLDTPPPWDLDPPDADPKKVWFVKEQSPENREES